MHCKLLYELYIKSCNEKINYDNKIIYPIAEQIQINNCIKIIKLYSKNCPNKENNINILNFL